jgi:hypothetical protein
VNSAYSSVIIAKDGSCASLFSIRTLQLDVPVIHHLADTNYEPRVLLEAGLLCLERRTSPHSRSFADELSLASRLYSAFASAHFAWGIDSGPMVMISMVAPSGPVPSKCI